MSCRTYFGYSFLICFILSGFLLNLVQLIVFVIVRPFSKRLYREINHYILYSCWSQTVAVADWYSNLKCRVFYKDREVIEEFGKHSGVVIANHRYDIDWLVAWMVSEKLGMLGGDKAMLKASLWWVPVVGWGWTISDMIFLYRNWQKDRVNLAKTMDILLTYPRSLILCFFEGTRLTPAKYEASRSYAAKNNINVDLKHHLLPRTRGFNCMVERVKEAKKRDPNLRFGLYNLQTALENDDNSKASLTSILSGRKSCVYIYVEKLNYDDIPANDEEAASKYLYDIYKEKDNLVEYFKEHGKFPGIEQPYKPRIQSLLNLVFWMITIYYGLFCLAVKIQMYTALIILSIIAVAIVVIVNSTKVSKSSSYGATAGVAGDRKQK